MRSSSSSLLKRYETYPDSVGGNDRVAYAYNRQAQPASLTDQNGTVHSFNYDKLGRRTDDRITALGSGVDNAVLRISQSYEVRGLTQNVTSYDSATVGSGNVVNDIQRVYNGFAQLTSEYQSHSGAVNTGSTPRSQYAYADGSADHIRPTSMTYPNGRVLNKAYGTSGGLADAASRIASLVDNDGVTHLADYSYLGAGTIIEVDESQPHLSFTLIGTAGGNDPDTGDIYRGFDRFGRVKDLVWWNSATSTAAVRIQHGYDRAGNRLYRADLVAESSSAGLDELYSYDGIYRVKSLQRGTLTGPKSAIQNPNFGQCWMLDATGNWKGFRQDDTGSGTWNLIQSRSANPVNEITGIVNSAGPTWAQSSYDAAGNMTSLPKPTAVQSGFSATYDAWHRLIKLVDATTSQTVQMNGYDGLRRRVVRNNYTSGTLAETRHYYYSSSWQVLEERVGTSTSAERQFVWGLRYIDDLILRDRDTNGDGVIDERLYALQDPNFNLVGLTDSSGTVQERYSYDAYGVPTFLTASFAGRASSNYAWETLYAGYRWDTGTGLYVIRNRILNPKTGAWAQRDPIRYRGGYSNLSVYAGNRPLNRTDPKGLDDYEIPAWSFTKSLLNSGWEGIKTCGSALSDYGSSANWAAKNPGAWADGFGEGWQNERISPLRDRLIDRAQFQGDFTPEHSYLRDGLQDMTGARGIEGYYGHSLTGEQIPGELMDLGPRTQMLAQGIGDFAGSAGFLGAGTGSVPSGIGRGAFGPRAMRCPTLGAVSRGGVRPPRTGATAYRLFGDGARPGGSYYSPVRPDWVTNYPVAAGLPSGNTGRFLIEAEVLNTEGVVAQPAARLYPAGTDSGTLMAPEWKFLDPATQLRVINVQGINPPLSAGSLPGTLP